MEDSLAKGTLILARFQKKRKEGIFFADGSQHPMDPVHDGQGVQSETVRGTLTTGCFSHRLQWRLLGMDKNRENVLRFVGCLVHKP